MKRLKILLFAFVLFSCNKYECVKNAAPEMIGDWENHSANNGFHYIYIKKNRTGSSMYGINDHGNNQDTQSRKWYIKDDVLYFSRFQNKVKEDMFTIDAYPTVTPTDIFLQYDTIPAGRTYMILNGRYYLKIVYP